MQALEELAATSPNTPGYRLIETLLRKASSFCCCCWITSYPATLHIWLWRERRRSASAEKKGEQSLPLGLVETRTSMRVSDRQATRAALLRVLGRRPGLVGSPRDGCRSSSLAEGTDDARLSAACSTKHAGTCAFVDRSPLCRSLSPTPRRSPSSRFCQPARPGPSPTSRFCHVARPRRPPTTPEAPLFRSLSVTDRATCAARSTLVGHRRHDLRLFRHLDEPLTSTKLFCEK